MDTALDITLPVNGERVLQTADLRVVETGSNLRYEIDFDAFEAAITPQTKLFILCNPHNPLGRVWTRAELEKLAEICLRHDLIICADEIHSDLILEGKHIPIASLSPEIEARTITLLAPSKTFNVPGLGAGMAIIPNEPNPGPTPVPDLPPIDKPTPPIKEPEPDRLPDEEPNPNPDENDDPPRHM